MGANGPTRLSFTRLSLYQECPRCFYLEVRRGMKRPQGIFPTIASGLDRVSKNYLDGVRAGRLNPPAVLKSYWRDWKPYPDQAQIDEWRDWRKGLRYRDQKNGVELVGMIDDCLVSRGKTEVLMPIDFKSRGFPPKPNTSTFYELQLDMYALLLRQMNKKVGDRGLLIFLWPESMREGCKELTLRSETVELKTDYRRAENAVAEATRVLRAGMPSSSKNCEFCRWARQ